MYGGCGRGGVPGSVHVWWVELSARTVHETQEEEAFTGTDVRNEQRL